MSGSFQSLGERPWKGLSFLVLDEVGVTFEGDLVRVPYRLRDGREHNAKLFGSNGRSWWETPGRELIPFGVETLPNETAYDRALLIAEGESDALALREAFAGVTTVNPIRGYHVLGLPGAGTWRREWSVFAEPFPVVYLLGDGDERGREMNDAILRDVPWARPVSLRDGEDVRSIVQRDGSRALDAFFEAADRVVRLYATFRLAEDLATARALLSDEETLPRAA